MATDTATAQKNFVGGNWVDAVEGATMDVINPATYSLEDYTQIKHVMAKIG